MYFSDVYHSIDLGFVLATIEIFCSLKNVVRPLCSLAHGSVDRTGVSGLEEKFVKCLKCTFIGFSKAWKLCAGLSKVDWIQMSRDNNR
jgi:hypothetical protein